MEESQTFGKGDYAKAIAEAQKLGARKEELASEAQSVVSQFESRIQSKLERATWLLDNGYSMRSKDQVDGLVKDLKGSGDMLDSAMEVQARYGTDEMKLELKAAAKINRLLEKVYEDGRDEKLFDKLDKLANEFSGTKVAARARRVAAFGP